MKKLAKKAPASKQKKKTTRTKMVKAKSATPKSMPSTQHASASPAVSQMSPIQKGETSSQKKYVKVAAPPPPQPQPKASKRARVDESHIAVTEFNIANPANVLHTAAEVDYSAHDKQERAHLLAHRMKVSQLSPSRTQRLSNNQQAFSIFAIPCVVDTKDLSCDDLRRELEVRSLSTEGNKAALQKRLDDYLMEFEAERLKASSPRVRAAPLPPPHRKGTRGK